MSIPNINIKDFSYHLPDERIALAPLPNREASKMLVFKDGHIQDKQFQDFATVLPTHTFIVLNETKVIHARLHFTRATGAHIEIFCLKPAQQYKDITTALAQNGSVDWQCIIGNAKKWKKTDEVLTLQIEDNLCLYAQKIGIENDTALIRFSWSDSRLSFAEILHLAGSVPLPPYIKRELSPEDEQRYQTVFARVEGSVAAPTASLHLTRQHLDTLLSKGHQIDKICLHVGAGTFMPVKNDNIREHQMHEEAIEVSTEFIEHWINYLHESQQPHTLAVGTTACRTLESLYWIGVKLLSEGQCSWGGLLLHQWEAYTLPQNYSLSESLQAIVDYLKSENQTHLYGSTQLLIAPGYTFRAVDILVTNFHQPQSTLLLLVAAFVGDHYKLIYQHALDNDYRFLSYGDGSVLFPSK